MSDNLFMPLAVLAIALSAALSWFLAKQFRKLLPQAISAIVSGCLPLAMPHLIVFIWPEFEHAEYKASGSQHGFMGPMTFTVFGFPLFFSMLIIDLFAAAVSPKRS